MTSVGTARVRQQGSATGRPGALFVAAIGTGLGAVLAPVSLVVPLLWQPSSIHLRLGSVIIGGFVLTLSELVGLTAGLSGALIGHGLARLATRLPISRPVVLAVGSFGTAASVASLLTYVLKHNLSYSMTAPLVPSAIGAVALAALWRLACKRSAGRGRDASAQENALDGLE